MPLASGARLGPYEVLGLIGAGGMGEVYKARDTRLDRTVAIKVLPAHVSADPERRARFEREAKTISALNHPHICTLHDVGEQDGTAFLVMEHLEGETLAERLRRGALPLPQALDCATQIADALSAAHKQGVIHRDLKPGNVMLTKMGVKLLDFGLAKLKGHGEQPAAGMLLSAPTQSGPLTGQGTILGTLQYMAPEQLEGKPADARTDLFAFGAIVYEMMTGQRVFEGASSVSLIGNIMNAEPPSLVAKQPLTPPAVDRLVRQCLAKATDDRPDTAHDVANDLRWMRETSGVGVLTGAHPRRRRVLRIALVAAVAVALPVAAATVSWMLSRRSIPQPVLGISIGTGPADGLRGVDGNESGVGLNRPSRTAIALSPDGVWLVFSAIQGSRQALYRRKLAETTAVPIDGTEGADTPFFSPDGRWVGFWARQALWKTRLEGGTPIELCPATRHIAGASWSTKDLIVFDTFVAEGLGGLRSVSAAGGPSRVATEPDAARGEILHVLPSFLPDGETLLFTKVRDRGDPRNSSIAALSLSTGKTHEILEGVMDGRYLPSDHLVYARLGRLEAVPFDPVRVAPTGAAVGLIPDVMQAVNSGSNYVNTGAVQFTTSGTGTLIYVAGGIMPDRPSELVWVDRRGSLVETLPIPPDAVYSAPKLSPDAQRIVYVRAGLNGSLWCYDIARRTPTLIPTREPQPWWPIWTPDGQRVVFAAPPGGITRLHTVPVDGRAGSSELAGDVPQTESEYPGSWTPDGRILVYSRRTDRGTDLWVYRTASGAPSRSLLLSGPALPAGPEGPRTAILQWPAVSPDGHWLAYVSNESGRNEVYVQRFLELGERQQLSRDGGRAPVWRRDGRELFYTEERPYRMMAVDVRPAGGFTAGEPRVLFELRPSGLYAGTTAVPAFDVSPDGQRFLFVRRDLTPIPPPPSQMRVVVNWFEELKAKVPVK